MWRHDAHDQPVYFEAAHQKIFRVGIESGTLLHFERDKITVATASPKYFDYAVLGYAVTVEGLIAPFDEEDTRELFKVERCSDLFAFWTSHPNEDLYTPNRVDLQAFAKPPQTPS